MDEQIDYNSIQKDTRGNLREAPIQENKRNVSEGGLGPEMFQGLCTFGCNFPREW